MNQGREVLHKCLNLPQVWRQSRPWSEGSSLPLAALQGTWRDALPFRAVSWGLGYLRGGLGYDTHLPTVHK